MRIGAMLVLACFAFTSFSQVKLSEKTKQKLDDADHFFDNAYYNEAIELYQQVLEVVDEDISIQLKIAEAFYKLPNKAAAEEGYKEVFQRLDSDFSAAHPRHFYNYAEIQLSNELFNEALHWYQLYKKKNPDDSRTDRKIKGIVERDALKKDSANYEISEVPFNSEYADFSPSFLENGLVFISGREEALLKKEAKSKGEQITLDMYYTHIQPDATFSDVKKISNRLNADFHEGPAVFYNHDHKVIFTRSNYDGKDQKSEEAVTVHLHLFYSETSDGVIWSEPALLSIDNKDYSIGHPAITSDAQLLYFSSNMPGGFGGTDLYVSRWINNDWGTPVNLGGDINTEGNEMFPFVHGDTTLYFASNGHAGSGGLDIYSFSLKNHTVTNAGYPINSHSDDFGLILNENRNEGYFSSNRKSTGSRQDDNIYRVVIHESSPTPLAATPVILSDTAHTEVYYTIQILALKKNQLAGRDVFNDFKQVLRHKGKDGYNRYTYGKYKSLQDAGEMLQKVRAKGYEDAFVRQEVRYKELSVGPGIEVNSRQ